MKNTGKLPLLIICILMCLLLCLGTSSCSIKIYAEELSKGYSRKATDTVDVRSDEYLTVCSGLADFSFSLLSYGIGENGENEIMSPLSAAIALSMLTNGADGETKEQLEDALGASCDTLNKYLYSYVSGLYSEKKCKVSIANSVWFNKSRKTFTVNDDFLQSNADWYSADIFASDFDSKTLKDINNWVKKNTDSKIDQILDQIEPETAMYLINTVLFEAEWGQKSRVEDGKFLNGDGSYSDVKMLASTEGIYIEGDNFKGVAKPYMGGRYSFVGILPDECTDVLSLVSSFSGEKWLAMWESRKGGYSVSTAIPEFSYSKEYDLIDALEQMGIKDLFDGDKSDLSRLGTSEAGNLYCSLVKQKTFISLDKNGTSAAAATVVGVDEKSAMQGEEREVILDRPFLYAIVDDSTGMPLFIGVVSDLG